MLISSSLPQARLASSAPIQNSAATPSKNAAPLDRFEFSDRPSSKFINADNVKIAGISVATGALGYAGSVAHNIPYVGPIISGVAGAISGAAVGAIGGTVANKSPIAGAAVGAIAGSIIGATYGGTAAANIGMAVAGATVPAGLLVGIFSTMPNF